MPQDFDMLWWKKYQATGVKLIALVTAVTCGDVWGDVVTCDLAPAICRSAVQCVAASCESRGYELFVIFIPVRLGLFLIACDMEIITREEGCVLKTKNGTPSRSAGQEFLPVYDCLTAKLITGPLDPVRSHMNPVLSLHPGPSELFIYSIYI
jgi:hypothetical protein